MKITVSWVNLPLLVFCRPVATVSFVKRQSRQLCNPSIHPLPSPLLRVTGTRSTVARGSELECSDVRRKLGQTRSHEAAIVCSSRARVRSVRSVEDSGEEQS